VVLGESFEDETTEEVSVIDLALVCASVYLTSAPKCLTFTEKRLFLYFAKLLKDLGAFTVGRHRLLIIFICEATEQLLGITSSFDCDLVPSWHANKETHEMAPWVQNSC
jgi:hypothetical protein